MLPSGRCAARSATTRCATAGTPEALASRRTAPRFRHHRGTTEAPQRHLSPPVGPRRASRGYSRRRCRSSSRASKPSTSCSSRRLHPNPDPNPDPNPNPNPNADGPSHCHLSSYYGVRWVRSSRPSCCGGHSRKRCRALLARRTASSSTPPHSAAAARCSTSRPSPCVASSSVPRSYSRCGAKPHTAACSAGLRRSRPRRRPGRWAASSRAAPLVRTMSLAPPPAPPPALPAGQQGG